jgi:hypothetical protein
LSKVAVSEGLETLQGDDELYSYREWVEEKPRMEAELKDSERLIEDLSHTVR